MNILFKIAVLQVLWFCFACEKKITSYSPEVPPIQVISGVIVCDSAAKCYITKPNDLNTIKVSALENAKVFLYNANNSVIDTLHYKGSGLYKGKIILSSPNIFYKIISYANGYNDASCEFKLPSKPDFTINDLIYNYFYNWDPTYSIRNLPKNLSHITIQDTPNEDFYQLELYDIDSVENLPGKYDYKYNFINLTGSDNPAIKQEGEIALDLKYFTPIFFNDKLFNGVSYELDFYSGPNSNSNSGVLSSSKRLLLVVLKHISKEYYLYLKTVNKHLLAINYSGEGFAYIYNLYPYNQVYSNIDGGTGILGSVNSSVIKKIVVK